jgi:hypothetical protein
MAIFTPTITAAQVLSALTSDSTKFAGANIARLGTDACFGQMDFWSDPSGQIAMTTVAGDKTLESVYIPDVSGFTVKRAIAMLYVSRAVENSGGVNYPASGADKYCQVDLGGAGFINAIKITEATYYIQANGKYDYYNMLITGNIDISSRISYDDTTDFKLSSMNADANTVYWYAVRSGIRLFI